MSRVNPRVLKGFRDYLPDTMAPRQAMLNTVAEVFSQFGFGPLATPALEYTEILLGKYGTEGDKLLYRFEDNGGRDVSLRYDLTVPLARVVGQHTTLPTPFKRYQIAPVWRAEKPGRGRFREFLQCDVDIVGSTSLLADFECMQVGIAALKALGVEKFELRVNDRRVLDGLMARLGVESPEMRIEVLRVVDKLPKVGWDGVTRELSEKISFSEEQLSALHTFLHASLEDIGSSVVDMEVAQPGIDALNTLLGWASDLGIGDYIAVDLSIARGLDYYTSTIYETFLTDMPDLGSVMSGGRYDDLLSLFSKNPQPAVGISLGVDRLLAGLLEMGLLTAEMPSPDVFVTIFNDDVCGYAQAVAADLRAAGLSALLHLNPGQKMGKQFKQADRCGAAFVVIAGPDEVSSGQVRLKNLATGEQVTVARLGAPTQIREWQNA
ncbi:MAG: histidyl-tRNA synthetase [Myxococcota bacterium]|jgi:histidyl-tRNA synthetase